MAKKNDHRPQGAPPPPPPPPPKKRRRGPRLVLTLLVIIILLLVILLMLSLAGYGPGAGLFGKDNDPGSSETSQSEVIEESSGEETVYAEIKVSGGTVLMDGSEISAADAAEAAKKLGSDVVVRITDDSATQNTMEELKSALDAAGLPYTIE
ncbi:MAG: hypothetical protein IJ071_09780 [Ruminococcus sp.]|nr:hypothetical protein [Ruminococcus sp.]